MVKSDGTVIKFINDNSTEIYTSNGTIYRVQKEVTLEAEVENVEVATTISQPAPAATNADPKDKSKRIFTF